MIKKILMSVSYDGTIYSGWQRQLNSKTVQEEIEKSLSKALNKNTTVLGCSRTDSGVHAIDQKVTFKTESSIPPDKFEIVLNKYLPNDIRVNTSKEVDLEFHPRIAAKKKQYQYEIINGVHQDIRQKRYSWHVKEELNIKSMQQACKFLIGTHDFTTFCAAGSQVVSKVRTIYIANLKKDNNKLIFTIEGDGFLYKMVRIIVGTLVDIGLGKINANDMKDIIVSKDRKKAMTTAPPQGLCLMKVEYKG